VRKHGQINLSPHTRPVGALLFDQTLATDTASIDTGAVLPPDFSLLDIFILGRTTDAAAFGQLAITFNNDTGANYDWKRFFSSGSQAVAADSKFGFFIAGATSLANAVGVVNMRVPGYAQTTFFKACVGTAVRHDSLDDEIIGGGWRSTAAINRVKVASLTANLKAGSRLLIYGMP
jgi:hypothetical protein